MRRSARNRLTELLLRVFEDPRRSECILWLSLFCNFSDNGRQTEVPLVDLLEAGSAALRYREGDEKGALAEMIGPGGLFRIHRADTREELLIGLPDRPDGAPWLIGLWPDVRPDQTGVCERASAYARLLTSFHARGLESYGSDPLQRAVAQAAACFDAGLFFEAHEHLEQFWRNQPKGESRRLLQGIIQISVGFHHARRGNYNGAVNQLAKGLEKTAGVAGEVLGLDWDPFVSAVAKIRDAIVARGRGAMRPISLTEIPRMQVLATRSLARDPGRSKDQTEEKPLTPKSPFWDR